jgi:integrase
MTIRKLTADFVRRAVVEDGVTRTVYWDEKLPGFGLLVTANGHRSWVIQYRHAGRTNRITLSSVLDLDAARKQARMLLGEVAKGNDPAADRRRKDDTERNTLRGIVAEYFAREGDKLRSSAMRRSALDRLVLPALGGRPIYDIRRSDIVRLLDKIESESGPAAADQVLKYLSKIFAWFATRSDAFQSPITRGMGRLRAKDNARQRTLSDVELRAVWLAAESFPRPWGIYIRMLLLTGARRNEIADLQWSERIDDDALLIPGSRTKNKLDLLLPLSATARALLDELPRIQGCDFAFTTSGVGPITSFGDAKAAFDKACGVTGWRFHDLRRTARTLLSRAGVPTDIAEQCLGHAKVGIRGVYDRWEYRDEKLLAFEKLATLIESIVRPQQNVVALRGSAG